MQPSEWPVPFSLFANRRVGASHGCCIEMGRSTLSVLERGAQQLMLAPASQAERSPSTAFGEKRKDAIRPNNMHWRIMLCHSDRGWPQLSRSSGVEQSDGGKVEEPGRGRSAERRTDQPGAGGFPAFPAIELAKPRWPRV